MPSYSPGDPQDLQARPIRVTPDADSVGAAGTATAPTAAAAIVTVESSNLPAGIYELSVRAGYGGVESVVNNMDLRKGGSVISALYVPAVVNGIPVERVVRQVTLDGTETLTVNAVATATASTVFISEIFATKID